MKTTKNRKQKILAVALIAGLIAILSMGSLAWFTAQDSLTNTINLATDFDVTVFEHDWSKSNTPEVTSSGLTYSNVMPGQTIHKDPTVRNSGQHDEYVRVYVTLNNYPVWKKVVEEGSDLTEIFVGFDSNIWKRFDEPVIKGDNITYLFYLEPVLHPFSAQYEQYTLFTYVKIPGDLTSKQAEKMNSTFTISVTAEAIQAENLPVTTARAAFAHWDD